MQLRSSSSIRRPGRYREDEIPVLPGVASFVHPTVLFNPNLPPAAFPTLNQLRPVDTRPAEAMAVPSRPGSPDSELEQETLPKRATVFHGEMQSSNKLPRRVSSSAEWEKIARSQDASKHEKWDSSDKSYEEPGEYDGYAVMANDDGKSPRIGLTVYELRQDWAGVTDGLKLIIVMELTTVHTFEEAMKMLILTNEEINEIIYLFDREIVRRAEEDAKIARSQARQLRLLMCGTFATSQEAFSASLEESLYTNLEDPVSFIVSKTDLENAETFLKSIKLNEYANRLWRYEGVAASSVVLDSPGPEIYQSSSAVEFTRLDEETLAQQAHDETETGLKNGEKGTSRKSPIKTLEEARKALLSKTRLTKRPREGPRLLKLKVTSGPRKSKPSGLRNSISVDNLEKTVASGPAALQPAFSPQRRPAPPPRRREKPAKKFGPLNIRLVKKPLAKRPASKPSSIQFPTQNPRTPERPISDSNDTGWILSTERGHIKKWLPDHVEPYGSLATSSSSDTTPSPQETPSRAPNIWLTSQTDKILGTEPTTAPEPVTPDRAYALQTAPPIGALPEIFPEKTRSAPRRTDADSSKELMSVADIHEESFWTAHSQKKRKGQEPDESPSTVQAQKRVKVQSQVKENEQPSSGKENKSLDIVDVVPFKNVGIEQTATKGNVSEALTAKFKGVKLLEQTASAPAPQMNKSNGVYTGGQDDG